MKSVSAGELAQGLICGMHGSRDDWGSETEALCQFYELVAKAFGPTYLMLPEHMSPAEVANTLESQLKPGKLTVPQRQQFAKGLGLLRTVNAAHFRVRLQ